MVPSLVSVAHELLLIGNSGFGEQSKIVKTLQLILGE